MLDPTSALARLLAGNERYVKHHHAHEAHSPQYNLRLAKGQQPFAIVLGCSDSRIVPEIIFDQGLGDLFVVRVAGNIVDPAGLASIEYAVEHLGVRLVMVLGHEYCGAVTAAIAALDGRAPIQGHLCCLIDELKPAVQAARGDGDNLLDNAIRRNVERVVGRLRDAEPVLARAVSAGQLAIVGGRYDFEDGVVDVIVR